ncbi:MAG: phasin, PhaP [Pseudomonadota bacterium]
MAQTMTPETFFKDAFAALPLDTAAFEDALKSGVAFNEKLTAVALSAADQSADLSNAWTRETLTSLGLMAKAKEAPADYAKELTDFASTQASVATEKLTALSEIAKSAQTETMELFMDAAKSFGADAQAFVETATEAAPKAARKVKAKA